MTIDRFAKRHDIQLKKEKYDSVYGQGLVNKDKVVLVKPMTFMNLSGQAVCSFIKRSRIPLENILVVCDDVNLDFGVLRLRPSGSSGGHNGLESIIGLLKSNEFTRLRIGIGGAGSKDLSDYVLEPFGAAQKKDLEDILEEASNATEIWLTQDIDKAMSKVNIKKKG